MSTHLAALRRALRAAATPDRAKTNAWFFKTGKGEYGEGDRFLGVTVPQIRAAVRGSTELTFADIAALLASAWHEERLAGALTLVRRYERGDAAGKKEAFDFYLAHSAGINNWDIVDSTAPQIVGTHLLAGSARARAALLGRLARSSNLWERRIAIVATQAVIRTGQFADTFRVCDALMKDGHDLLHKACGWMLREVGKKDEAALAAYLAPRFQKMPRTMLRYAIEKFPAPRRKRYLAGTV